MTFKYKFAKHGTYKVGAKCTNRHNTVTWAGDVIVQVEITDLKIKTGREQLGELNKRVK